MRRVVCSLVLGVGLLLPTAAVFAQDHPHHDHEWTDTESPAWRRYLKEHHRKYHDWNKASKRERDNYWRWREKHPDAH